LFWIFLVRLSEFFVFTSFQKKKATGIAKKRSRGKKLLLSGINDCYARTDYRRFLSGNRQEVPLVRTNCRRGIRFSILPQRAAAVKKTVVAGGITAQNRIAARKKPCCLNSFSFVAVRFTSF
jgi:hypothetical protein